LIANSSPCRYTYFYSAFLAALMTFNALLPSRETPHSRRNSAKGTMRE
jgi:hypothetical protein